MGDGAPRLLFVPVSGPYGMGEYARSLAIARAASQRAGADIHMILSREAPYAASTPFPTTLLASSATFHSEAVAAVIAKWRPDIVIFDNAGRTSQLRAAKRAGARVVYISARRRQRGKAFRLRWMRLIDEHWIAYPKFIAGGLGLFERLKLHLLNRPVVRYLDVIVSRASRQQAESIVAATGCAPHAYVLVVPGGGTGHPGAADAAGQFLSAARKLAFQGLTTVFVGPVEMTNNSSGDTGAAAEAGRESRLHLCGMLPQTELAALMGSAQLIVVNGGSSLLQAIACGGVCVAVPIAKDQSQRIAQCVAAGVAVASPLDAALIAQTAADLLRDGSARDAIAQRGKVLGLADGVEVALQAIGELLNSNREKGQ